MSTVEMQGLVGDIKNHGQKLPVWVFIDRDAGTEELLDGRNRLDAMEAAGIAVVDETSGNLSEAVWVNCLYAHEGVDPYAFVLAANLHRRHLDADQKRDVIAKVLKARPELSNRAIADQVKDDHKKVGRIRQKLEATGVLPQLEKTTGKDNKARTTTRRTKVNVDAEIEAKREQIDRALAMPGEMPDRYRALTT